jgi:hypothetical protein
MRENYNTLTEISECANKSKLSAPELSVSKRSNASFISCLFCFVKP